MKLIKVFLKIVLVIIAIMTIFWGGIMITLQTRPGQEWILKHSLAFIENQTGLKFQLEKIEFALPLTLRLHHLSILKDQEKLTEIKQIDLSCLYKHLFHGQILCSTLSVKGITIYSFGPTQDKPLAGSNDWIDHPLPFYFKIENLHLADIRFSPSLIHQPPLNEQLEQYTFDLKGKLSNNPLKKSITAHLFLIATDLSNRIPPLTMAIDAQNSNLSLSLHIDQMALADTGLHTSAAIYASAPFYSWKGLADNLPLHDAPIEGHLKVAIPEKQTTLKSKYHLLSRQEIELFEILLTGPSIELNGESLLTLDGVTQGTFKGQVQEAENTLSIQGKMEGPYSHLVLDIKAESPQLILQNQLFKDVRSSIVATYQSDKAEGLIELECEYNQIPCKITSPFIWDKQQENLRLAHLVIEALQSELTGELFLHTTDLIVDGNLQAHSTPLQPFAQLIDLPIDGLIDLNLTFKTFLDSSAKKHQGINCELTGNTIRWEDLAIEQLTFNSDWDQSMTSLKTLLKGNHLKWKKTKLENAFLEINWTDFWQDPAGKIHFGLQNISDESMHIQELLGESSFLASQPNWPFHVKGRGDLNSSWEMKGEGYWHINRHLVELHLERLNGLYANIPLNLLQPLGFYYNQEKILFSPLRIKWGEGELSADFSAHQDQFSLDFKTNFISSDLWRTINPLFPFSGNASVIGHLEGNLENPKGQVQLELHKFQISEDYLIKRTPLEGKVFLSIDSNGISINSQIFGIGRNPFMVKGTLPYKINFSPLSIKEVEALPLALDLSAEGELNAYLHLFVKDFPNISGQAKVALQLSGKVDKPLVKGTLDIYDAIYESQDTGAIYQHIKARLEGDGTKILLKSLTAEDSKGGTITGDGFIEMDEQRKFPYHFNIQASHLYILDSDYASISASGPLTLIGKKNKGKLQGNLKVDQATVQLEEALPKQIKTIDVNYINLADGQQPPLTEKNSSSALELDIKLTANEVLIEGNHLKSSWKGEIAIMGNTSQPLLFGDLRISSGEYELKSKTFNLTQGSIHFAGSPEKKTTLYVVASKEIDPIKVEMIVKGPLSKLVVSFRSNPAMSQREVLSYILFGRGISDITPGEGDTLNQSFVSLNASEQTDEKQDLLTRLRNNIGIDRLDFTASGEGENRDVALQVGKYIWKDVFISLNKSIGAASDRVAIEAKILKNVKAQAEVDIGSSSQAKISLRWKRDY